MLQLAIPVFVLMSVAAFLGFIVAWTWRRLAIQNLQSELIEIRNVNYQIESDRQNLVQHANSLQSEKERLLKYQAKLDDEKKQLLKNLEVLSTEKRKLEALLDKNKNEASNLVHREKLSTLEKQLVNQRKEIEEKEEEIKLYRQGTVDPLPTTEVEKLKEQFKSKYTEKKKKWEEKYRNLHFKLLKVARERDELKKEIFPLEPSLDFSGEDNEETPSLEVIKKNISEWGPQPDKSKIAKKAGFVTSDYGEMNKISREEAEEIIDDLQVISGISKTIEEKLNALGVYRYEQISRLEEKDILLINKILDLDADYISKNKWVAGAKKLK